MAAALPLDTQGDGGTEGETGTGEKAPFNCPFLTLASFFCELPPLPPPPPFLTFSCHVHTYVPLTVGAAPRHRSHKPLTFSHILFLSLSMPLSSARLEMGMGAVRELWEEERGCGQEPKLKARHLLQQRRREGGDDNYTHAQK